MRILVVHNYHKSRNGADEAAEHDVELLRQHGQSVYFYSRNNKDINDFSLSRKGLLFLEPTWSPVTYKQISSILDSFKPDVVHCHNIFPLVSPSVYYACNQVNVPVIQTLHDYRLLCPTSWLFRDGQVCNECVERSLLQSIYHGCYQGSRLKSTSVAMMLQFHRWLKTWQRTVTAYLTVSRFAQQKIRSSNLFDRPIFVRPNFLKDYPKSISEENREYGIFVGRLSSEKGLGTLLESWRSLPDIPLKILGEGPLRSWIEDYIKEHKLQHVELLGFQTLTQVVSYLQQAKFLVIPSIWYETFGRTIIEAYAAGTPVIASNLGAMAELVVDYETGLLFEAGDPSSLVKSVQTALEDPVRLRQWGTQARQRFIEQFTPQFAYEQLLDIYQTVLSGNITGVQ